MPSTRREGFLSSDCRSPFGLGPAEKESEVEKTMSKNYESKAVLIEEIKTLVDTCQSAVLVDYRGLTVEEDTALRKKLRAALGFDPIRNRIGEGYLMGGEET